MTSSRIVLGASAVIGLTSCEPTFVDVTFDGVPRCEGGKLTSEIALKIEGPRVSSFHLIKGDGGPVTTKLQAGKLYKLKAYKCVSDPCEVEANFFHGGDLQAPAEGKTGRLTLELPGAPGCIPLTPPPAAEVPDAG